MAEFELVTIIIIRVITFLESHVRSYRGRLPWPAQKVGEGTELLLNVQKSLSSSTSNIPNLVVYYTVCVWCLADWHW